MATEFSALSKSLDAYIEAVAYVEEAGDPKKKKLPISGMAALVRSVVEGIKPASEGRNLLKLAAKYNAVGDKTRAEQIRKIAEGMNSQAVDRFTDAAPELEAFHHQISSVFNDGDLRKYVSSGRFNTDRSAVMNGIVKPTLVQSDLPPRRIYYIWSGINEFLDQFIDLFGNADGNVIDRWTPPNLLEAAGDLAALDYKKKDYNYCDEVDREHEPIAEWKSIIIEVGRWVTVAICICVALIACQWEAVIMMVGAWMTFEQDIREFCGWVCE